MQFRSHIGSQKFEKNQPRSIAHPLAENRDQDRGPQPSRGRSAHTHRRTGTHAHTHTESCRTCKCSTYPLVLICFWGILPILLKDNKQKSNFCEFLGWGVGGPKLVLMKNAYCCIHIAAQGKVASPSSPPSSFLLDQLSARKQQSLSDCHGSCTPGIQWKGESRGSDSRDQG